MRTEFGIDLRLIRFLVGFSLLLGVVLSFMFAVLAVLDHLSPARALLLIGSGIAIPTVTVAIAALIMAGFRIRLLGDNVQHVALGRIILSEFPISHFEGVVHSPPQIRFTHRRRIQLLGMHPQTLDELERTLKSLMREANSAAVRSGDQENA